MKLIDTHTHLYAKQFDYDRKEVVQRAINSGVETMLLPNIDRSSIKGMNNLIAMFPNNCFSMMGLHPCDVDENFQKELDFLYKELKQGSYIAVGEIGIDLYWNKNTEEIQKDAFIQQLQWGIEFDLPVAIHIRNSFDQVFECIEKVNHAKLRGVFHCFTGNVEQAQHAIKLGFMLGVGGVVTFKNSGLDKTLKKISLEHLLLETDSPYLAPDPHRGKRNESSYLTLVAQKLAEINETDISTIAGITSENAKKLFRL